MVAAVLLGLAAGVIVEGAATYPGLWFPARWFYSFPGLSSPDLPRWQVAGVYYGALVILGLAWMWLLRTVGRDPRLPTWLVVAVFVVWSAPFLVGPPASSEDVYHYVGLGRMVERGLDPYAAGINALGDDPVVSVTPPFWRDDPSPYGPLFVRTTWLASTLTQDSFRATAMTLRLFGFACLLLLALPLTALARRSGTRPAVALTAVLCSPLVLVQLVSAGHNETLMMLLLAGGVAVGLAGMASAGRDRRPAMVAAGVALCGAAGAVKLPALLGAVLLGWLWAGRGAPTIERLVGAVSGLVAAAVVVVGISVASGLGVAWVRALDVPQRAQTLLAPFTAFGVVAQQVVGYLGWPDGWVLTATRAAGMVLGIVVAGLLIMRADRLGGPLALGLGLLVLAFTTPTVWPWYAVWGLVFVFTATVPIPLQVAVVALNLAVTPLGPGTLDVTNRPNAGALFVTLVFLGAAAWGLRAMVRNGRMRLPTRKALGGLHAGDG